MCGEERGLAAGHYPHDGRVEVPPCLNDTSTGHGIGYNQTLGMAMSAITGFALFSMARTHTEVGGAREANA